MESILKHSRRGDVTFYATGRIDISSRIVRSLHLRAGDVLDILFDEASGEHFLYCKLRAGSTHGRHEARLFRQSKHSGSLRCQSIRAAAYMLSLCQRTTAARVPVGDTTPLPSGDQGVPLIIGLAY